MLEKNFNLDLRNNYNCCNLLKVFIRNIKSKSYKLAYLVSVHNVRVQGNTLRCTECYRSKPVEVSLSECRRVALTMPCKEEEDKVSPDRAFCWSLCLKTFWH